MTEHYGICNSKALEMAGSRKINGNVTAINTGGHTEGHMIIIFEVNSKKYMYGGDLFPSWFHIKPYYITAYTQVCSEKHLQAEIPVFMMMEKT